MRMNKPLVAIFTVVILFWSARTVMEALGGGLAPSRAPVGEDGLSREDRMQALLTGEVKRQPRKNPEEHAGLLRCLVRAGDGAPIKGALVTVRPCDVQPDPLAPPGEYRSYWESTTDADGLVEFRTVAPGEMLVLAASEKLHGVARAVVRENGAFTDTQVDLWPVASLSGTVRGPRSVPVGGARVVPVHAPDFTGDPGPYRYLPALTGPEGQFDHPLLPRAAWQFLISAPGFAPALATPDAEGRYQVTLDAGETLAGRVLREGGGRAVNNARIELRALDGPGERYAARTNGQGFFSFGALRPAPYHLSLSPGELIGGMDVTVDRAVTAAIQAATPLERNMKIDPLTGAMVDQGGGVQDDAPVNVRAVRKVPGLTLNARAAGSIRGRVLDGAAGGGVAGVTMALFREGADAPESTIKTDQAGYYHLKSLEAGAGRVFALRDDGRVFITEEPVALTVEAGRQTPGPTFHEVLPVALSGRVLDGKGGGVPDVAVRVSVEGWPGDDFVCGTDPEGRFQAVGLLPSDKVKAWAVRLGVESPRFGPVTLGETGLEDVMLRLEAP